MIKQLEMTELEIEELLCGKAITVRGSIKGFKGDLTISFSCDIQSLERN